jgi:hypothetical protein
VVEPEVFRRERRWFRIQAAARDAEQLGLPGEREPGVVSFNEPLSFACATGQIFFGAKPIPLPVCR